MKPREAAPRTVGQICGPRALTLRITVTRFRQESAKNFPNGPWRLSHGPARAPEWRSHDPCDAHSPAGI